MKLHDSECVYYENINYHVKSFVRHFAIINLNLSELHEKELAEKEEVMIYSQINHYTWKQVRL